jgi:thiol-disulfide isomerase/thioredoxin
MLLLAGFTALVIVVIAALAVFSATGGGTGNFTPNDEGLIPVGEKAPGFTTETVGGSSVSVEGDARATMLVFFATWCPHCQKEAPVMSELESQYDGLRMVMVGIDGEDDPEKVQRFVEEYDIESPAVYEPGLGSEFGISGYPTTYVLDGDNRVVGAHSGEAPREVYEGWIEEAL